MYYLQNNVSYVKQKHWNESEFMGEQGELKVSKASREEVEKLLNRGLRQRWYPIAPSWMVQENPLGVTRLSEHLEAVKKAGYKDTHNSSESGL